MMKKFLLDKGNLYTVITRECGVSKATIYGIKAQYDPNRPFNEPGRPKILKNREVAQLVRQVTLGAIDSAQKASKIIDATLDKTVSTTTVSRALHSAGLHAKKKKVN
jgi:transposase